MKLIYCFAAATLLLSSCSSNDETLENTEDLVPVVVEVSIDNENVTRSYLGQANEGTHQVPTLFEEGDHVTIVDGDAHVFTVNATASNTTMSGSWHPMSTHPQCFAIHPSEAIRQGYSDNPLTVSTSDGKKFNPTIYFYLPVDQTSRDLSDDDKTTYKDKGVSYQENAGGLSFSCPTEKDNKFSFIPVVSYLYFYSSKNSCTITSDQFIAGNYTVTYLGDKGTDKDGHTTAQLIWNHDPCLLNITADSKQITCHGDIIEGHNSPYYEYLIAIKPDKKYLKNTGIKIHYINTLTDPDGFYNHADIEIAPNVVYYLGCIDPVSNPDGNNNQSAPVRDAEMISLPFGR